MSRLRAEAVEVAARRGASPELLEAATDLAARATAVLEALHRLEHALGTVEGENEGVV